MGRRNYTYDQDDGLVCTPVPDEDNVKTVYNTPTPNPETFVWQVLGAFVIISLLFTAAIFWVLRPIHIKPDIQEQHKLQDKLPIH